MNLKRFRAAKTKNFETEYIDLDKLFNLYLEQFKAARLALSMKYEKMFYRLRNELDSLTLEKIHDYAKNYRYIPKVQVELMIYPSRIAMIRTICFA